MSLILMSQEKQLSGILIVNKPKGMISKDVSRWLTRRIGKKVKLGHVGTLDPAADGVLPLLIGKATRLQDDLLELPKSYYCEMQLGYETDTLDLDGKVITRKAYEKVDERNLHSIAESFEGLIEQVPPIYSAVKFQGKPLYSYAREGRENEVDLEKLKRQVTVYACRALSYANGLVSFEVTCSKGTYIRVLAKKFAEAMGTVGTVTRLCRTQAAGVKIEQAYSLEEIEQFLIDNKSIGEPILTPLKEVALNLPSLAVDQNQGRKLLAGQLLTISREKVEFSDVDWKRYSTSSSGGLKTLILNESSEIFALAAIKQLSPGILQLGMKRSLL